jgi:hypothetical protein
VSTTRWDETWHRLREWTNGQTPSERLAAQVLMKEGFASLDPSHPLGGRDGGKDAVCIKDDKRWVMAVYFPLGQKSFSTIKGKFLDDSRGAQVHAPHGIAFVTNQELTLSERKELVTSATPLAVDLYHLERVTAILDSPAMSEVRKQFLGIDYDNQAFLILGGQGGLAPGAGGGGGGALGTSARGGDGGPGGKLIFAGSPGLAPGSGGGGSGVVGDNAQGGQGGGGGDLVQVEIGQEEMAKLREEGFDRIEFRVGEGGKSDGPGEDTIANFVNVDGKVLKTIVAKAGVPGAPPKQGDFGREVASYDIESGLNITALTLSECAQVKNGLLYLLGAGWENFQFQTIPFEAQWPLVCTIDTGSIEAGTVLTFKVIVKDPTGFQVLEEPFHVLCGTGPVSRPSHIISLSFTGSQIGVWAIAVESGGKVHAKIGIDIKGPQ